MTVIKKIENPVENPFPMKILALVLAVSMVLFLGLGWYTWYSYLQLKRIQEQDFRLQELAGIITHLDEVLTMSARLAAATGDLGWEERYRSFEPKLDAAIKETIKLAPEAYGSESAAQTDAANIKLVEIENRAFGLVRQGERGPASNLLLGEEYEEQKRIYAEGIRNISAAIKERVEANLRSQRWRVFVAVTAIGIALPALIFSWIGVLRAVGTYLAERKRTEEETQRHLQRITALREINVAIASTLDLSTVLERLLEKIDLLLPYSAATIRLFDRETGKIEPVACRNLDEKEWKAEQWRGGRGIPNVVFERKSPWMVRNVQTDPSVRDPEFFCKHGLVSYLGVPLIVKDEILGVISFYTKEEHEFSSEEVEFLTTLAGQAAIAIHNSQLHKRTRSQAEELEGANKDLKRREEIQKLLKELSQDITSLELDSLLKKLTDKVREILKADVSDVRILKGNRWTLKGVSGIDPSLIPSARSGTAFGRSGWIIRNRKPLLIPDASQEKALPSGETINTLGLRGYAGVPLFSRGGAVIGVLRALTYQSREFTQEEVDLLQQLANGAATAIENARLFEEVKRKSQELEALFKINRDVAALLDREVLLPRIAEEARRLLKVDGSIFRLIEGESLVLVNASDPQIVGFRPRLRLGEGLSGKIAQENRVVAIKNVLEDPTLIEEQREIARKAGCRSFLGVPLRVGDRIIGTMNFYSKEEREFQPEEISLITAFADQAAIAIENANLYQESRRGEEIQKLLKELSQDITFLDIGSLLKKVTEKAREVLKVDVSDVRVVEGGVWRVIGVSGIEPYLLSPPGSGTTRGLTGWTLKHRKPFMVQDITRTDRPTGTTLKNLGFHGCLGVPLFSRAGEVIGVLRALSYEPRDFTQEEVDLLQQLANGAAIALENARLLEQTKKQAFELEEANKVKDEFLGFVSHELRTPVNAVIGYTAMMQDGMLGEINPEQEKILGKVLNNSNELLSMINSLLQASRIEAGAVKVESHEVNLGNFLDELRSRYDVPLDKELNLVWDYPSDLPVVTTDREKLRHILQNLVNNAIKFTEKGSVTISAHLSSQASVKFSEFKVADTGIGIAEDEMPFIFDMFRQVEDPQRRSGGVGLGLHIVKKFTELLGGKIDVESEPGKGSTFTVRFPTHSRSF